MKDTLATGSKCFLDGTIEVIVVKPATRSNTSYIIENTGGGMETMSKDRLTVLNNLAGTEEIDG